MKEYRLIGTIKGGIRTEYVIVYSHWQRDYYPLGNIDKINEITLILN